MRLLLDTHALIWGLEDNNKLSLPAHDAIGAATQIYVSAASIWEATTKYRNGKLTAAQSIVDDLYDTLRRLGVKGLPISMDHAHKAGLLPGPHKDPFDRMLIAQALIENLHLVSNEEIFDRYGVKRVW